ncbi:helix-turn-helix domain-containing GNAT family N-acetyltransferase [Streptomyces sp. SL13]|uniref:Helix-turn-helix domain-containing GNAT family N-acetyltransferase n=1 Tax=Streptantibioticus silvisoli TaxID=2705255 RepID=A0AA90H4K8_9ACTN|nr:helix-turn-helix domain-containing GNAT family N-acetyltransferase [Streptantibioticus silvisoli]MDI5971146.1 helix-turn-helix domain-containing GNAT family N-acetyltransferase [Streptantibioticus silvisoli]
MPDPTNSPIPADSGDTAGAGSPSLRPTVNAVLEFNRFHSTLLGALDQAGRRGTPYSPAEARVLDELKEATAVPVARLRETLRMDRGQLSRVLARLEEAGLVVREPHPVDRRAQSAALTDGGREAARLLDSRSYEAVGDVVNRLAEGQRYRLVEALRTVRETLTGPMVGVVTLRGPEPGDLGWVIERNAAVYAAEFGWNGEYEALVARIVADFASGHDERREALWIAELDGRPAGCVFCVRDEAPGTARLRLLLVDPRARGHRIGQRLVRGCVEFARTAGYRELVLWTNDVLGAARRIYQEAGFELVAERPHHSFGQDLVGQDWRLVLHEDR